MTTSRRVSFTRRPALFALAALALATASQALAAEYIVKNGRPQAEIVIAADASPMTRLAARELQTYVEKITGAKLPVVTTPSRGVPAHVYVGRSTHTDQLKVFGHDLRHGAYRMASGPNWLALVGRDTRWRPKGLMKLAAQRVAWVAPKKRSKYDHPLWREWDKVTGEHFGLPFSQLWKQHNRQFDVWDMDERGSFNAVADFLRTQGVRWYMPGELGEIVPKRKSIALPKVNRTVRPDFVLRYPYLYGQRFGQGRDTSNMMWQLRMGFSQAVDVFGPGYRAHGIARVIGREETKKTHPEYYALMGGRRITRDRFAKHGRPCLSSPALIAANVRFCRAMFDVFDMPMVSVMPTDGFTSICQCKLCQGKGQPERGWRGQFSNYVWGYCDKVAREVYKTHPDRKVTGMAYTTYMLPPTNIDRFSPNMIVSIAQHRCSFTQDPASRKSFQDLRKAYLKMLPKGEKSLYAYDYYRYAVPGKGAEFTPAFFPHAIAADLRDQKDISLGDYIEVYTRAAKVITGLNVYVTGRCWWDANLDVDALLEEYYTLFYGPAREEMKAFIGYSEKNWMDLKKVEKIDKVFALMAKAEAKAPPGSVYAKRIARVADYIEPLKDRRRQLTQPRDKVPRAVLSTRDDARIKMDGKLDEKVWRQLRTYTLRELRTGRKAWLNTRLHVFWRKGAIYFGIVCQEHDMKGLNISATRNDDTSIWAGDEVEILIETQVHSYYQLCISPAGALVDIDQGNPRVRNNTLWSSNAEVAVHRGAESWTVEVRIPVAAEGQANIDPNNGLAGRKPSNAYPWYFNVCRQRVRGVHQDHWAFSPTGAGFQKPRKFAELGGILRNLKKMDAKTRSRGKK